jgi:hypothetical protein
MRIRNILDGGIPIIVFALIWEGIARMHLVPEYIFPSFSVVMQEFYHLTVSGVWLQGDHKQVVSPDIQSALSGTNAWMGATTDDLDRNKRDATNRTDIPVLVLSCTL